MRLLSNPILPITDISSGEFRRVISLETAQALKGEGRAGCQSRRSKKSSHQLLQTELQTLNRIGQLIRRHPLSLETRNKLFTRKVFEETSPLKSKENKKEAH